MRIPNLAYRSSTGLVLGFLMGVLVGCGVDPRDAWRSENAAIIQRENIAVREREIPPVDVASNLDPLKAYSQSELPVIQIAPGVAAAAAWGRGTLYEWVEMDADTTYPEEVLDGEVISIVQSGSLTCSTSGQDLELVKDSVLYLAEGAQRSLKAGPEGCKLVEVFSPVRRDHLKKAGASLPENAQVTIPDQGVKPSLEAGKVYDLHEIQLTPLTPPVEGLNYKRSEANSRLIWGENTQLSLIRMDALSSFPMHVHPEDQFMVTIRGTLSQGLMDTNHAVDGQNRHTTCIPGGMVHSGDMGEKGADALDIFWPVRPDYVAKAKAQNALYHQVIVPGTRAVKLAEGFTFCEGPTWLKGNLYFSDMYFASDWTGDPKKSRLIRMSPDGQWKVLSKGMQTNGTLASRRGNLLVCDMFGHRVVEMDPRSGRILKTVLKRVGGAAVDGPNDLVMDAKGGIYVSDPQFTPESRKSQPGTQVYYVGPDGSSKVVIPAGEYAMPNGVEVSPDGKTFYVNNTWKSPGENFVWAYEVAEDGSLSNKRKFAALHLTSTALDSENPEDHVMTQADGMAVDTDGRIYVGTLGGVQIFDKTGTYVGTIWTPELPVVSCSFGGENYDQLYMVAPKSVWVIQTQVKGFRVPEGLY